ncbi:MAG TPA: ferredoxin-thioredoxin reductase catalytic domain-containing protein [Candidatus Nanoarchaeia archaeon]|nr:ferredoxin-thioredoxin reductase catalytic domain-containing protein [Candidatus Nanoarchaeia archaeon]
MNKKELLKAWENYTENNDFMLNPDKKFLDALAEGVLKNEKDHGLKLCPCRLRDKSRERDLELLCPCNFKIQDSWTKWDRCWCGLFVRRKSPTNSAKLSK